MNESVIVFRRRKYTGYNHVGHIFTFSKWFDFNPIFVQRTNCMIEKIGNRLGAFEI